MTTITRDTAWLIWSHKHNAWWGPDRCGYTTSIPHAGVYSEEQALEIEQATAYPGAPRNEPRPLSHCVTDGVAPMRDRTVVALLTLGACDVAEEVGA